ncbi:MAG: hypothetical protein F6K55_12720 [Moorea sp. SIO4A3]|nr:hypothetical protein [Moorena sp. SIO4A3]
MAIDQKTREIVGVYIGDRTRESANKLWKSFPPVVRQCAVCYTDFWEAYKTVIPKKRCRGATRGEFNSPTENAPLRSWGFPPLAIASRQRHKPVEKQTGKTNHIERLNNTLRQRISRLVRKTLSFSKKLENNLGAIWNFVHHYNKCLSG